MKYLCLKNAHSLIFKYFIAEKCSPSLTHRVGTNLQPVKNAVSAKRNESRCACAGDEMGTVERRLHLPGYDLHSATV